MKHRHRANDCRQKIVDKSQLIERLSVLAGSAARVVDYWRRDQELAACPGVEQRRAEMAYAAERDLRVALKLGMDMLNDLIDTGTFSETIADVRDMAKGGKVAIADAVGGVQHHFGGQSERIDLSALDELTSLFTRTGLKLAHDRQGLRATFRTDQAKHDLVIPPNAKPGDTARVGAADFFGARLDRLVLAPVPVPDDEDCHHTKPTPAEAPRRPIDVYGGMLGAMALAKEAMYRHARSYEEMGPPAVRGAIIPLFIIIVIIVSVVALAAGGVIVWLCTEGELEGGICTFGKILMAAGVVGLLIAFCSIGWCAGPQGIYVVAAMFAIISGILAIHTKKG